jgi:hypothetical protein
MDLRRITLYSSTNIRVGRSAFNSVLIHDAHTNDSIGRNVVENNMVLTFVVNESGLLLSLRAEYICCICISCETLPVV